MLSEPIIESAKPFFISRLLILVLLIFSSQLHVSPSASPGGVVRHPEIFLSKKEITQTLLSIFSAADAGWYINIAKNGYHREPAQGTIQRNWAFFPLYPLLLSFFSKFWNSYVGVGVILSNISFFFALVLLYKFSLQYGMTKSQAAEALWLLCLFPTSYFFSAPFTESLFLLLVIGSFYLVQKDKFLLSALCFSLSTATRPLGLLMLPGYLLFCHKKVRLFSIQSVLITIIAPLGIVLFMLHLYALTGDPLAFSKNQAAWGRGGENSLFTLVGSLFKHPEHVMTDWNFTFFNCLCVLIAFLSSAELFRKKNYSLSLLTLLPVVVSILTGTLQSMGRIVMVLFPIFLLLAKSEDSTGFRKTLYIVFTALLAAMTIMWGFFITSAMA